VILYTRQFCSSQLQSAPCTPQHPYDEEEREKVSKHNRDEKWENLLWKFALNTTNVLLLHLSIPYLMLHLSRLLGTPAEQQQARSQPIQPMNRPQVLQIVFFGKNKDHSIVTISTARVNLLRRKRERESEIMIMLRLTFFLEREKE
jgi:hypothetical protein